MEIDAEKGEMTDKARELKDYNNLINMQLKINRERFILLSQFLEDSIEDIKSMDEVLCNADKSPNKLILFTDIDLDSLSYKRRNYKTDLESFNNYFKDCSLYEKELYDKIVNLVRIII